MEKTVNFMGYECSIKFDIYLDGGATCITLICKEDGQPVAVATINCPNFKLEPGMVIIKNYSENEGVLEALIDAGVIKDTGMCIHLPHTTANICRLLVDPNPVPAYEKYALVRWPKSQELMERPWFDQCILADESAGSSAYFVPIKYIKEL